MSIFFNPTGPNFASLTHILPAIMLILVHVSNQYKFVIIGAFESEDCLFSVFTSFN